MRLIIYSLMLLACIVSVTNVTAVDFNYTVNASAGGLPFSRSEVVLIVGKTDMSFNITSSVNFTTPNITSIQLQDTNNFTLKTDLFIPANYSSFGNSSVDEILWVFVAGTGVNESNETVTQTTNITFMVHIVNGSEPPHINSNGFVQLDINVFSTTLCNYTLPFNRNVNVTVSSNSPTVPIVCNDTFLNCADSLNFTNITSQTTSIGVNIFKGLAPGIYRPNARFYNTGNVTNNVTFIIEILDCPIPLNPIDNSILKKCENVTQPEDIIFCADQLGSYFSEAARLLREANRTNYVNITQEVNVTEFVPVIPINNSINSDLLNLKNMSALVNDLLIAYRESESRRIGAERDKNESDQKLMEFSQQLPSMVAVAVNASLSREQNLTMENINLKNSSVPKKKIKDWAFYIGLGLLGIVILKQRYDSDWMPV